MPCRWEVICCVWVSKGRRAEGLAQSQCRVTEAVAECTQRPRGQIGGAGPAAAAPTVETTMRSSTLIAAALLGIVTASTTAAPAAAQSCEGLWVERNSIYKEYGYCFKTQRAIAYFGNAGCMYEYEGAIPFPPGVRGRINQIVRMERAMGCR